MRDAADIIARLRTAALRRRAPLWAGMALPWVIAALPACAGPPWPPSR